jgi:hypothetical protein
VCAELGVERLPGDHCYEFFTGSSAFAQLHAEELGTFFLTDYLVKHFDRLVVKAFWLDTHPELLPQVFANYRRLVYLAQSDDPELVERARAAAVRLGLDFELRRTGLGNLEASIVRLGLPAVASTGREPAAADLVTVGSGTGSTRSA